MRGHRLGVSILLLDDKGWTMSNHDEVRDVPLVVSEEAGMVFLILANDGAIARINTYTHCPPSQACTPHHTHAMTARLNTGQSEPKTPKVVRQTEGKVRPKMAPWCVSLPVQCLRACEQ
jgi:hypothetical protein